MARMLSQVATIIRGSVGGLTYLADQYHQIVMRARTSPVQPNTTNQAIIRSVFSEASEIWKSLTDEVRADWNSYAATCFFQGPLGPYAVSGRGLFMGARALQQYIAARGLETPTLVTTAPTTTGFATLSSVNSSELGAAGTGFAINISNTSGEDILVMAERSLGFHPSRLRYKGPYESSKSLAVIIPGSTSVHIDFPHLEDGNRYFWRVKGVVDDGPPRLTAQFQGSQLASTVV